MRLLLCLEAVRLAMRLVSMYTSLHGDGTNYTEYSGLHRRIGSDGLVSDWTRTKVLSAKIRESQKEQLGAFFTFLR